MPEGPEAVVRPWIETFQAQTRLDLRPLWQSPGPRGAWAAALADPWGAEHRPDWHRRGLLIWPRGGRWQRLRLSLVCPEEWRVQHRSQGLARLVLRWWADAVELRVDGALVHQGDLFDTACRWVLPESWWAGGALQLELLLRSPLHDDGALITSQVELEPQQASDPSGLLLGTALELLALRDPRALAEVTAGLDPQAASTAAALKPRLLAALGERPSGGFQVLGHAHLDLAWLWPVADTWQAAVRTFASALALIERNPQLHFAHSSPALYAWVEQHHPALFARIRAAMQAGRWEPINGPWVESDCVLISSASLLRQFEEGQAYSRRAFPEWRHDLCWLPDSFGFAAGLPAVAAASGVRWFCTHKLAWNATNPFPHRLFRWRSRCGQDLRALITAGIGTDGDPVAMERYRLEWQRASGLDQALWLPGVGDHGGGPTAEMLQQLELWQQQPSACPQRHGSLRDYLAQLEPLEDQLPVWRDELYLELHRGCATSRPDQKRHNRSLERLLREADLAAVLAGEPQGGDWRPLLFQQFHDILPGTSIPEVFEQAEPQWRQARRSAARQRDRALLAWLSEAAASSAVPLARDPWWLVQLQPLPAAPLTLRLPPGQWSAGGPPLPQQPCPAGGTWVQLPGPQGVAALPLQRQHLGQPGAPAAAVEAAAIERPVLLTAPDPAGVWHLDNGLLRVALGPEGVHQLWGVDGLPQLAAPLEWRRFRDDGEFWDAWDIAAGYRDQPLPGPVWQPPQLLEQGPLCCRLVWRGRLGGSGLRLDVQLRAASPYLELQLHVDWRQRHELLRLELPLAQPACRWAADTGGGVIERPAAPTTAREQARWEVAAISWLASQAPAGGMGVLLDGPQGVSGAVDRLGVSLLRGPTWPDPSADNGDQRLRLALVPCVGGWRQQRLPQLAQRFREPLWLRPAPAASGSPGQPATGWELGDPHLQLLNLRPAEVGGEALLDVQNLSPLRQRLQLPPGWCFTDGAAAGEQYAVLGPWQLLSCRLRRGAQSS